MPTYEGEDFARFYRTTQAGWAAALAPDLLAYLAALQPPDRSLLDLCCGTGELLAAFAADGWRTVGVDNSPAMAALAEKALADHVAAGAATVIVSDAAEFAVPEAVGAAVCLNGSVNHLRSLEHVQAAFTRVRRSLRPGGRLVFDAFEESHYGDWDGTTIVDEDDAMFVNRGFWFADERWGVYQVSGVVRAGGEWLRARQAIWNRHYTAEELASALEAAGLAPETCTLPPPDPARRFYQARAV